MKTPELERFRCVMLCTKELQQMSGGQLIPPDRDLIYEEPVCDWHVPLIPHLL